MVGQFLEEQEWVISVRTTRGSSQSSALAYGAHPHLVFKTGIGAFLEISDIRDIPSLALFDLLDHVGDLPLVAHAGAVPDHEDGHIRVVH
mgnify:CR=1 FL=1